MLTLLQLAGKASNRSKDIIRQFFIGAIAIRRDGVIVSSRNTSSKNRCFSGHAETRVLRKSGSGATIYVSRVNNSGQYAMAKPCPRCMAALVARDVHRVYYTIDNNSWGCITF